MSYGSYDNQSSLNQPFNPTATTGIGNDFGRVVGNAVADKLFGQNAQGPLSGLTRGLPGMVTNSVLNTVTNQTLPGAPSPEARQNVERSQAGGGILKLRQPATQPGGKSGGGMRFGNGKSATPMVDDRMYQRGDGMTLEQQYARPDFSQFAQPAVMPGNPGYFAMTNEQMQAQNDMFTGY